MYEGVGADASGVVEVALPFLGGEPYRAADPYRVVFAAQPSVPGDRAAARTCWNGWSGTPGATRTARCC